MASEEKVYENADDGRTPYACRGIGVHDTENPVRGLTGERNNPKWENLQFKNLNNHTLGIK